MRAIQTDIPQQTQFMAYANLKRDNRCLLRINTDTMPQAQQYANDIIICLGRIDYRMTSCKYEVLHRCGTVAIIEITKPKKKITWSER
jgi:hypothetical protein